MVSVLLDSSKDPGSYLPKCTKEWTTCTLPSSLHYISLGHILYVSIRNGLQTALLVHVKSSLAGLGLSLLKLYNTTGFSEGCSAEFSEVTSTFGNVVAAWNCPAQIVVEHYSKIKWVVNVQVQLSTTCPGNSGCLTRLCC